MNKTELKQLLTEHEQSDLSLASFARSKGIPAYRLYNARRQARLAALPHSTSSVDSFSEVQILDSAASLGESIHLELPSGLSIRLTQRFDEVALRRLLGVLSAC